MAEVRNWNVQNRSYTGEKRKRRKKVIVRTRALYY